MKEIIKLIVDILISWPRIVLKKIKGEIIFDKRKDSKTKLDA
jgi:hypothetical protein